MKRIGPHGGAGDDSSAGDGKLLLGPSHAFRCHTQELSLGQYVIIVRLGQQRRAETRLQLVGLRALDLGARPAQLEELGPAPEQIVAQAHTALNDLRRQRAGPEVEALVRELVQGGLQGHRGQHEDRPRRAPAPLGVVDLAERRYVVRIEPCGGPQCLREGDPRDRVRTCEARCEAGRRAGPCRSDLQQGDQRENHWIASTGSRTAARPFSRARNASSMT